MVRSWIISASVAPRRLVYANEMGWEHYKDDPAWERHKKLFVLYGVPDSMDEAHGLGEFPGPGECADIGPAQLSVVNFRTADDRPAMCQTRKTFSVPRVSRTQSASWQPNGRPQRRTFTPKYAVQ